MLIPITRYLYYLASLEIGSTCNPTHDNYIYVASSFVDEPVHDSMRTFSIR